MRRGPLSVLLISVMVASTFFIFAVAVLASAIIDDLGVSRTMIGLIAAVNTGLGAVTAPWSGRLTDRIGPRNAVLVLLTMSVFTLFLMGVSTSAWMLIVAGVVGGLPQGWGNPATNALIAAVVEPGSRGVMTGIKQSGVTLAVFLAGSTLPGLTQLWSWQGACLVFAALFAALTVLAYVLLPSAPAPGSPADAPAGDRSDHRLPPAIRPLATYAVLMGLASGSIGRFLPLFAEESLGYTAAVAGMASAMSGLLGAGFRILAARRAEHRAAPPALLVQLSFVAAAASVTLALAPTLGAFLLWPAVVMYALGHTAWNAVLNFAVIFTVPADRAGRASGIIMLGFLMGLTVAGPVTGMVVDTTADYTIVWWASAALAVSAATVLSRMTRSADPIS